MVSTRITPDQIPANFNSMLDVSVHRANTTLSEIRQLCETGVKEGFNVITNACFTKYAREFVGEKASIHVGATVGFPFGTASTTAKAAEARKAIEEGANEVDMVMAVGFLREGAEYYSIVQNDIHAVVEAVRQAGGGITKVIIETCYLTNDEKIVACKLVTDAGADFVKTSTGYGPSGATLEDVRLMRKAAGSHVKVKAAGGIRTLAQCIEYIDAGVDRIGIGLAGTLPILEEVRQARS